MIFSTPIFLFLFLPLTILIYYMANKKIQNTILLIASLIFYAWGEPLLVGVMLSSILMNYFFGLLIIKKSHQKFILLLTVMYNLGMLFVFKYLMFFIENINSLTGSSINVPIIPLPVGISFFTFQAMSYVIDVYRNEAKVQKNLFSLALYITFFPQLIAGPIVRYKDIDDQIRSRAVNYNQIYDGIRRFTIGLGKKVLIANVVAEVCDSIFRINTSNWTTGMAWLAMICYTLQIYFDFSAYSDMAIGLGKMFGFDFLENFDHPYKSKSIKEFWRRWHISLSTWFRDYLYIPLGGNRKGKFRAYMNQLIVFILCGFWHGASWNFLIWGLIHGGFLIIENVFLGKYLEKLYSPFRHFYTLIIVITAWVFFRAEHLSDSFSIIHKMFIKSSNTSYDVQQFLNPLLIFTILIGIVASSGYPVTVIKQLRKRSLEKVFKEKVFYAFELFYLNTIILLSMSAIASGAYNPFIYFRF